MTEHIRRYFFIGMFACLLLWESIRPFFDLFKHSREARVRHLLRNVSIAAMNAVVVSGGFVTLWAWAALYSEDHGIGLLHQGQLDTRLRVVLAFLLLDGWTYYWHRLNHRVPLLWRFHRTHHSDTQMDVTTAGRFHLGEITLSSLLRIPLIFLVGARLSELVGYEAMMFAVAQFHHANIGLPEPVDRLLRLLIVTPAMHKVHHSRWRVEADSNYTSFLSFWDRLFGTFRLRPDPRDIRFGVDELDRRENQTFLGLIRTPSQGSRSTG